MTFVKISLDSMNVVWHTDDVAMEVALPSGFRMDSNDLAGRSYSKVQSFRVPQILVRMLIHGADTPSVWHEALELDADANIDVYSAPTNWPEKAKVQSEFLAAQDSHTGRAMFLYMPEQAGPYDELAPGRGMLDTEFYLPQLRIPKYSSPAYARPFVHRRNTGDTTGHSPNRARPLKLQPESEGEDWISEADRDARLA